MRAYLGLGSEDKGVRQKTSDIISYSFSDNVFGVNEPISENLLGISL